MARIEQTELTDAVKKFPSELSGGMQKRAALARALITDPRIVLFDEPTTGQDPVRKNAILSMIAQYHRKFGFTAILVSHEIPDVYFISNRVLALYERTIVFQGTPEELEAFDHPFKDEVIHSLEALQKELTGFYSKRQFKVLNHAQLRSRAYGDTYSIAVFTLEDINSIITYLGHDAVQEAIRRMGLYIDKHFGAIGGFSTRRKSNEIVTVLPYSDITEAEIILKDFTKDFQGLEINDIWTGFRRRAAVAGPVEFTILAGIAQGQPIAEIDSVIASAKSHQKEIWTATMGRRGEKI
jgi:phospholipid/cholesterol/gamma-HCH transport system ATP-binding protein